MLVKPTTAVFWILPALAYRPRVRGGTAPGRRIDPWVVVVVIVPLVGSAVDATARRDQGGESGYRWLTSWGTSDAGILGGPHSRLHPGGVAGHPPAGRAEQMSACMRSCSCPPAIAAWRALNARLLEAGDSLGWRPATPELLNLYFNHDYYLRSREPGCRHGRRGLGAGWVWGVARPRWLVGVLPCALLLLAWGTLQLGRGYWLRIHGGYDDPQVMPLANEIASHIERRPRRDRRPRLVSGRPLLRPPTWAHGRDYAAQDAALDAIHRDGYRYLLLVDPLTTTSGS